MTSNTERQRRVAVIGAGASGLTVAKRLKAEGLKVTVYERQSGPGGVWKFTENASDLFASPVYGSLETNFPRELMEFSDFLWTDFLSKDTVPVFPKRNAVEEYLRKYSKGVDVEYGTEVVKLLTPNWLQPYDWRLTTRRIDSGKETIAHFDYVVMATGTFDRPFVPAYRGFRKWEEIVVVVGNSASGWDISAQIAPAAEKLWVASTRPSDRSHAKAKAVKKVVRLAPGKRQVIFDGGERATKVDKIIFCTGYLYSSRFLRKGVRSEKPLHIFWTKQPRLAFIGIPKVTPTFLTSQAQSAAVARAFSRRIDCLPTLEEMASWVKEKKATWNKKRKRGETGENTFHNLEYPRCKDYIDGLERWCVEKDEEAEEKAPEDWVMLNRREIRAAFKKQESDEKTFPTPESLGLSPAASQVGVD
ncbi:FAD/NAD(P)-binding domain-containing protein [Hypoxylon rubiginosum]|uniref:FAD/NAD(P)-binding domain-containing protein n=1 Tax=Hypoxylon rubiginosum TaxID=110542 RepID=A0ACB9Z966_9PEZI|nr:FAD/NAD(P)-binding domain-containing protein [Hypoxylon rubiginosum]